MEGDASIQSPATVTPALVERGKFWEVTYRSKVAPFSQWELSKTNKLATETGKTHVLISTAASGARAINISGKRFETCDFNHFAIADSSFRECAFVDCRFIKSDFTQVKFSGCKFDRCHFLNARFRDCQFLGCSFSEISAAAEQLQFERTAISARALVDALVTNMKSLPVGVDPRYQEYRHLTARTKIARAVFVSVRDDPDLDQLFEANRCFELALQRQRIEHSRWTSREGRLLKRGTFHRALVWPFRLIELRIIQIAGFFTAWGSSPFRSLWYLAGTTILFAGAYGLVLHQPVSPALLRAVDCSLVFGYTKYAQNVQNAGDLLDWLTFLNAFAGFCWYALFFPALSKRLFR
jgi:hypothetical protein